MKEKRPISTVQTALQMSSGKKKKVKRLTLYKLKYSTFLMSVNGIFSLNVNIRCYMREPLSLRLNINMKRGNAVQFYLALHLRMPEDFVSINNPCTEPVRLSEFDLG